MESTQCPGTQGDHLILSALETAGIDEMRRPGKPWYDAIAFGKMEPSNGLDQRIH